MTQPPAPDPTPPYGHVYPPPRRGPQTWLIVTLVLCGVGVLSLCWVGALGALLSDSPPQAATQTEPTGVAGTPQLGDADAGPAVPAGDTTTKPAVAATTTTKAEPVVVTTTITETEKIPYETVKKKDPNLAKGKTKVVQAGVNGVRTRTYQVTTVDGVQTEKKLISSKVTKQPVDKIVAVGTKEPSNCHPSYTPCVPIASDADCAGGSGNGPVYVTQPVRVIGPDDYRLDTDDDGWGCEDD